MPTDAAGSGAAAIKPQHRRYDRWQWAVPIQRSPGPSLEVVSTRNKGRRGRSRKRRPAAAAVLERGSSQTAQGDTAADAARADARRAGAKQQKHGGAGQRQRTRARDRRNGTQRSRRERPQAPWHPLPLSELLILVGAIGTVIGLQKGVSHGSAPLLAGLAAVVVGTVEVTLREHLSGFRSHAVLLSLLAATVLHTAVVLIVAAFTHTTRALNVGLLALDAAVFAAVFKLLRARFRDARRERVFAGR